MPTYSPIKHPLTLSPPPPFTQPLTNPPLLTASTPLRLSKTPIIAPVPPGTTFSPALLDRTVAVEAPLTAPLTGPRVQRPRTADVEEEVREMEYGRGRVPRQIGEEGRRRRTSSVPGRERVVGWLGGVVGEGSGVRGPWC